MPSTYVTLESRPGLWGQLTKFWKDTVPFLLVPYFQVWTVCSSPGGPGLSQAWGFSCGHLFSSVKTLDALKTFSKFLQRRALLSVSEMWSFRTKLSASGLQIIPSRFFWISHSMTLEGFTFYIKIITIDVVGVTVVGEPLWILKLALYEVPWFDLNKSTMTTRFASVQKLTFLFHIQVYRIGVL